MPDTVWNVSTASAPALRAAAPAALTAPAVPIESPQFTLRPRELPSEALDGVEKASHPAAWTASDRAEPEPTIEITIGRIEVKAPPQPPAPRARPARPGPRVSLTEY
ncbi:MAG TPA: hypothetical protein VGK45_04945, partial [Thermoanaerobaculia bacterium]